MVEPSEVREQAARMLAVMFRTMRTVTAGIQLEPEMELTPPQYFTLRALHQGDLRASELAERMLVSRSTMTAVVDALVRRGYVARGEDPNDRRGVRLALTPAGRHVVERWTERSNDQAVALLGRLTPVEREALDLGFQALGRVLGPVCMTGEDTK